MVFYLLKVSQASGISLASSLAEPYSVAHCSVKIEDELRLASASIEEEGGAAEDIGRGTVG